MNKKTTLLAAGPEQPKQDGEKVEAVSGKEKADLITDVLVFGHGVVGSMEFGYNQTAEEKEKFSYGMDDAEKLNADAFNNNSCSIDLYTCNPATPTDRDKKDLWTSLAAKIAIKTKTNVTGYEGRSD